MTKKYEMPSVVSDDDTAFNFANFLHANTGSIFGNWVGKMAAADQRKLTGRVFAGRSTVSLDGNTERITAFRKVCFGTDYEFIIDTCWAKFEQGHNFNHEG